MESERSKVPNALMDDYLPVFVVKYLRQKLRVDDEDSMRHSSNLRGLELEHLVGIRKDSEWEDDALFEENPNFEGEFLLTQDQLNHVGIIMRFANEVVENFWLDKQKIGQHFFDGIAYPCVELLYLLDAKYNVLPVSAYMLRLTRLKDLDVTRLNHFKQQLLAFCFSPNEFSYENRERSVRVLELFMKRMVLTHYCNPCNTPELEGVRHITGDVLKQVFKKLVSDDSTRLSSTSQNVLLSILIDVNAAATVKRRFFVEHIKMVLQPEKKPYPLPEEIFGRQEEIASPVKLMDLENFQKTISQVIQTMLSGEDVMSIISSSLSFTDFNWEILLNFISVWVQVKAKSATMLLKEFVKSLIRKGLEEKDDIKIMIGFIVARHCSLVAEETFFRYEKWFTNFFESEKHSPANDADTFTFLTNVLTEWVRFEPCCFLRVHSTFWPFIPKGCRIIWNDYVQLAKARIAEFNEKENSEDYVPNQNDPIQHQISTVLKSFEKDGKVPSFIHKLFIFRKQEYLSTFLPALIRKPSGTTLTDSRLRLIEILNQQGKIPPDIYASYRESRNKPQRLK